MHFDSYIPNFLLVTVFIRFISLADMFPSSYLLKLATVVPTMF